MTWIGQVVACRVCGADDRWDLLVYSPVGLGDVAWGVCSGGHRVDHPLIYPDMVRLVAGFYAQPLLEREPSLFGVTGASQHAVDAQLRLDRLLTGWAPRWVSYPDGATAVYRDWTEPGCPVDWGTEWPELVAARARLAEISEWLRGTHASDTSFNWMSEFGTTEPDLRRVEIAVVPPQVPFIASA